MTMIGMCHMCGRPATDTCPICGLLVCPADSDPATHVCRLCAGGKGAGAKGRSRRTIA